MRRRANLGLAALVLLPGATVAAQQDAATRAATAQVQALLDIDHTDVEAQLERMPQGTRLVLTLLRRDGVWTVAGVTALG